MHIQQQRNGLRTRPLMSEPLNLELPAVDDYGAGQAGRINKPRLAKLPVHLPHSTASAEERDRLLARRRPSPVGFC